MTLAEIKSKAKGMGINPGRMKKADLIHAIQTSEGNTPCFGSGTPACPYTTCCWRMDCLSSR